jgi:hypothetical protein
MSLRLLGVCVLVLAMTGCATRDVLTPTFQTAANPNQGVPVRIEQIKDDRVFQVSPPLPSTPSLMDNNISDESIRSRAFGRKRGPYGIAMGDLLVEEGKTIASVSHTAIARAFREAGYRVVEPGEADYAAAAPITVRINKLWLWMEMTIGMWNLKSSYEVVLTGPVPGLQNGLVVNQDIPHGRAFFTTDQKWTGMLDKTLTEMYSKVKKALLIAKI